MADTTTVYVAKIITIRGTNNGDATTAISQKINTWRGTNGDLNTALRDAPT